MNILIFSAVKIYPADAGSRIRILNFTKYLLSQGHQVHYVYYTDDGISKVHFEYMSDLCDTFTVIAREEKFLRKTGNYTLDEVYEESIYTKINELINIFDIEAVMINYFFYSKFFEYLPKNIYKIIDTHDKFTDRYTLFEDTNVLYDWHSYAKEDEAKALNRADMVLSITDEEKNYFSTLCNENVRVQTIGHIDNKRYLTKEYTTLKKIGFIGGANKVNIAAINAFLEDFYTLCTHKDDVEIVIAGQICNHITNKASNITLLGLIDELEDFYAIVDVVINPLTFGTGQKIKSVEALSFGLPILSTNVGFEGIKSNNKFHHLVGLKELIFAIDSIIEDPNELKKLAFESRAVFDLYCDEIYTNLNTIFPRDEKKRDYKLLFEQSSTIQRETYNTLIDTYLEASKRRNLTIKEQKKEIEQNQKKIQQQSQTILKNRVILDAIEEITKVSFIKHPIQKYTLYKKLLQEYYATR